jgi:hypothetical protein
MQPAKLALVCGLATLLLSACGSSAVQVAGSTPHAGRGKVDDPRAKRLKCLKQHHLRAMKVGQTGIQIGPPPQGAWVVFTPTPGAAQERQISGQAQGAEVIGSALLYPRGASDKQLAVIESCVALEVKG